MLNIRNTYRDLSLNRDLHLYQLFVQQECKLLITKNGNYEKSNNLTLYYFLLTATFVQ